MAHKTSSGERIYRLRGRRLIKEVSAWLDGVRNPWPVEFSQAILPEAFHDGSLPSCGTARSDTSHLLEARRMTVNNGLVEAWLDDLPDWFPGIWPGHLHLPALPILETGSTLLSG